MKVCMVRCQIERGAFSGERIFRVQHLNGVVLGGGHPIYFRDGKRRPLSDDVPRRDEAIDGFVQCRIVGVDKGNVVVELPGSEVLALNQKELVDIDEQVLCK